MRSEVFLDASYAIALSAPTDEHHDRAWELAEQVEAGETRLVTTWAIVLEIGNALARLRYRRAAVELLDALVNDPTVEIIPITERLNEKALRLYRERPDKEWGLTDCLSFVVMEERGLSEALTTDDHFRQAGFQALLREDQGQTRPPGRPVEDEWHDYPPDRAAGVLELSLEE